MDKKVSAKASASGIGFTGLLTILFIGLKLTGYIDWPWIWVLSPLWISFVLVFMIFLLILLVLSVIQIIKSW